MLFYFAIGLVCIGAIVYAANFNRKQKRITAAENLEKRVADLASSQIGREIGKNADADLKNEISNIFQEEKESTPPLTFVEKLGHVCFIIGMIILIFYAIRDFRLY